MADLHVSRNWDAAKLQRTAATVAATHTPAKMTTALEHTLANVHGAHLLALLYMLDACMKQSPKLVGAICTALDRGLKRPLRFHSSQSLPEQAWVVARIHSLLLHWGALNLVPAALAARRFDGSDQDAQPHARRGYFWAAARKRKAAATPATLPAPPLPEPVQPTDDRACTICGQRLGVCFNDDANGWVYADAVRWAADCQPVHHGCA